MSGWLQNLAKQGESFLDRLDQQAGAAIEQVEVKVQKIKEEKVQNQSIDGRSSLPVATSGSSAFSQSTSASRSNSPFNRSPIINRSGSTDARINLSRSFHQSENSFENSTNPNRASPLMMRSISQSSRLSSRDKRNHFDSFQIESESGIDGIDGIVLGTRHDEMRTNDSNSPPSGRNSPPDNSESEFEVVSGPSSVVGSVVGISTGQPQPDVMDLQLENRLLRQELNGLNMEITRLIDTQKKSDRELELQNQEIMRRRRSDTDHQIDFEKEREKHMRDIDLKESLFESEKSSLSEALSAAQISLQREKTRCGELTQQCRTLKVSFENLKTESDDYKVKAQRILQSKDKIIENLQNSPGDEGSSSEVAKSVAINSQIQIEELKSEIEILKEENKSHKMRIENLRSDLHQVETQGAEDYELVESRAFELENLNADLKKERSDIASELAKYKAELKQSKDDFSAARQGLRERLAAKDQEIGRIRGELMTKSSDSELEKRLRSLTETLINKQTTIEALSSDKSSLTLELERYKRNQAMNNSVNSSILRNRRNMEYDYESPESPLISDSKDDAVGKIKRAVGAVDKLSIRLGVLLKRYPTLRLLVIVYMIMLHIWTSVVLVTYEPEVHVSDLPQGTDHPLEHVMAHVGIDKLPLEED